MEEIMTTASPDDIQDAILEAEESEMLAKMEERREKALQADVKGIGPEEVHLYQPKQIVNLEPSDDPFDLVNAPGQNLIVLMRLYDVLMGIYSATAPDKAKALLEVHASGKVLLPYPTLVFDE